MLTTEGSSCLASWEKAVESWTGLGISSRPASLAPAGLFSARTAVPTRAAIRIPIDRVNSNKVAERSFWVFRAAKKRIGGSPKADFLNYRARRGAPPVARGSLPVDRPGGLRALRDRDSFRREARAWRSGSTGHEPRATSLLSVSVLPAGCPRE